ncbi:MAG TPA: cytochrome b/b6 domain-containing protein [Povalibacter sp.]
MRIQIWDVPIRLAHWLMVILIAVSWWTAENGQLEYHRYSGYTLLGLLVFRIYWGFAGSATARFANFVKGPKSIALYLKQLPRRVSEHSVSVPGHNPLGALSVLALLLLLLAQVSLGLFAVDVDGIESGPLSHLVSFETGRACAEVHETLFNVLLAIIALHIAAVLFYFFYKRDNLITAMIHGKRVVATDAEIAPVRTPRVPFVIGVILAAGVVWWITRGG